MQPAAGTVVREPTGVWVLVWTAFPLLSGVGGGLLVLRDGNKRYVRMRPAR